jgi:hypothetical protein
LGVSRNVSYNRSCRGIAWDGDEGATSMRGRKKRSGLDKYIIFSFCVMIICTIVEFTFSTLTGIMHDTLTTCLYGAFGGELLLCAIIKKFKLKGDEQ